MPQPDPQTLDALDKLFNAWLALNNILSRGGYLYKADKTGQIVHDAQGTPITVVADEFHLLIADPKNGFPAFAAAKGLSINTIPQPFPEK